MAVAALLTQGTIDAGAELDAFIRGIEEAGAVVSFAGIARGEGGRVRSLTLEAHPTMTASSVEQIAQDAADRFGVADLLVIHRHGRIMPGETIVFVAAAATHRRAAFEAADYAMDRLKSDAVLWKHEEGLDGDKWIEPREQDRADLARWD